MAVGTSGYVYHQTLVARVPIKSSPTIRARSSQTPTPQVELTRHRSCGFRTRDRNRANWLALFDRADGTFRSFSLTPVRPPAPSPLTALSIVMFTVLYGTGCDTTHSTSVLRAVLVYFQRGNHAVPYCVLRDQAVPYSVP